MEAIVIGLVLTAIIVFVIPLAVLRAGIRRLDRAASLTCHPPGLSAALARRVLGLYARGPASVDQCRDGECERPLVTNGKRWPTP